MSRMTPDELEKIHPQLRMRAAMERHYADTKRGTQPPAQPTQPAK